MLGVIGGMGPLATSLFYDMIIDKTGAKRDQDNLNMIILNHADMPDRTGAILSGETEEVRRKMLKDAMILELQGCDAIAVTCNTAHYFVDMIEKDVNIPFIHMIRETARELRKDFSGRPVAILATDGTIRTGLYQKEFEKNGILPYPRRNARKRSCIPFTRGSRWVSLPMQKSSERSERSFMSRAAQLRSWPARSFPW